MAGPTGQDTGDAASQATKTSPGQRRVAQWMRDYARLPGIPDEYLSEDGTPRKVWTRFLDSFASLGPAEIERRFGAADRHLREAGVTYRAPGDSACSWVSGRQPSNECRDSRPRLSIPTTGKPSIECRGFKNFAHVTNVNYG